MDEKGSKKKFDPQSFESKWQDYWEKKKVYRSEVDKNKPKYYVLDMFPYPSGAGLHVGHPVGYTATDVISRHKRQLGYNVMHPMGWDSFGLPAEQYAIRTGIHPKVTTEENIRRIKKQLRALGFDYDWEREIRSSDPSFYKWTQWFFTKLYEKGLAYQAELSVNFCPALGTVLANEEIEDGRSKIGDHPVEKRPLRQWVLKITAYADRLLEDLEELDWPESTKKLQRNWIGRSEGANIHFIEESTGETITVFTTRPETIFGVTFLTLAPEHPLVPHILSEEQRPSAEAYIREAGKKSDVKRAELAAEKTGVWTGAFCLHPVTGDKVPVWISDYVLSGYGTGAVMGVPGDDERDFDFAKKYALPILSVIDPSFVPEDTDSETYRKKVSDGECPTGGAPGTMIRSRAPDLDLNGLSFVKAREKTCEYLERKGRGEKTVTYKLRDWLFSRQRYWGEPIPILHLDDGSLRPLGLDELPLLPPDLVSYAPSETGESPLERDRDWVEIRDAKSGKKAYRETNTMPQWAGSCWYYLRYLDPRNDEKPFYPEKERYWMPDLYIGGTEHAVLHLLYARFWHKVLYDCGLVHTKEPFRALCNQGLVTAKSFKNARNAYVSPEEVIEKNGAYFHQQTGESLTAGMDKMSKSKLNGLSPDEVIEEFGADALRLYEMFMAPIEKEKIWNTESIVGCYRLLHRFYDLCNNETLSDVDTEEAFSLGHILVKGVQEDIESLHFNTAISKLMIFINEFTKLPSYPKSVLKMGIQCLYPFAPHTAYELWEAIGEKSELAYEPYPKWDPRYLENPVVTYVVQVNGKLRGRFDLPRDLGETAVIEKAREHKNISGYLEGTVVKTIFVPNKLLNFVIRLRFCMRRSFFCCFCSVLLF